jgi:putative membrane protein insertion efficiency factor
MGIFKFLKLARNTSTLEDIPSQFEQDIAEDYVCNREILRPDFTFLKALKNGSLTIGLTFLLSLVLYKVLDALSVFLFLPTEIQKGQEENPEFFFLLFFLSLMLLVFVLFLKKILIGIVKLYQHYASEDVRRRCLFKPTCSEYTLLVLQKHGVIIGLYKAYIRIFKKCRGNIYRIDFP